MSEDLIKVHSTITSSIKRRKLFRGTALAVTGALLIVVAGVFLPPASMNVWGMPIVGAGILLIAWGLIPYRRLERLEKRPDELILDSSSLSFVRSGKPIFCVPLSSIDKMEYLENASDYGIGLWLKDPVPEKIVVSDPQFDMFGFQESAQKDYGCGLYFRYFTKRSWERVWGD